MTPIKEQGIILYTEKNEFSDRKGIPVERQGRKVTGLTRHETA
jgi:hypothetical protein